MSLLVWLPLHDGTLKNLGMSPATFSIMDNTGSNIVSNAAGKTGQYSYARNTANTNGGITSDIKFYFPNDFSMACWCKVNTVANTDTANGVITHHDHTTGGGGITLHTTGSATCYISANAGVSESVREYRTHRGTTNIFGAWHHLALTYKRSEKTYRLYVDGIEECNFEYGDTPCARPFQLFTWSTNYNATSYKPAIQLNDVRLWDECISPTEVKLVSQGLFAHYTFNSVIEDDNIGAQKVTDSSGYGNNLIRAGSTAYGVGGSGEKIEEGHTQTSIIFLDGRTDYLYQNIAMPSDQITINLWFKSDSVGYNNYHIPISIGQDKYEISIEGEAGLLRRGYYINGVRKAVTISNSPSLNDAKFHMLTTTFNGVDIKSYVDGVLIHTENAPGSLAGGINQLCLGHFGTNNTYGINFGYLSDVRLYSRALRDKEIEELYKISGQIDNNNKFYCYELQERIYPYANTVISTGLMSTGCFYATVISSQALLAPGMKTKILPDGSAWGRILWHDVSSTASWFTTSEATNGCNLSNRYSAMNLVDKFKSNYVTLTNLIPMPGVNGTTGFGTSAVAQTSYRKFSNIAGSVGLQVSNHTSGAEMTVNSTGTAHYIPGHAYYMRMSIFQTTKQGSADFYWKIAEPSFDFTPRNSVDGAKQWTDISAWRKISSWDEGDYAYRIDYDHGTGGTGTMYYDGLMLIDLTAAFGAGNEPDKEWCDENIEYFNGTKTVSAPGIESGKYEFMLTYPKISGTLYNRWKQTSSANDTTVTGYEPIEIAWTAHSAGIRKMASSSVWNCDTGSTWYAALGQTAGWTSGDLTNQIPAANSNPTTETELWVRIDNVANAEKTKIYKDLLVSKDFIEY